MAKEPLMAEDPRILELLERMIESGSSADEVCVDAPELLAVVQEQWAQCQRIDAQIDALFMTTVENRRGADPGPGRGERLPTIPGYELQGILGRGGMGIVYRARHLRLNRVVALKMMLSGTYASRVERGRFLREAQAVAALRHANIVQIHDVGEHDDRAFFTMELLEGKTLAAVLQGSPQPSATAVAMVIALARAMESAHQQGIIHRDLKPSNVLFTEDGTPKIADFGLARRVNDDDAGLTMSGLRVGTPNYMAPEQALGAGDIGPTADIYALGAILYELLTGRPPFRGETPAETERQLLHEEPVAPSKLNARTPQDLEIICLTCLHKEGRRRYSSALALAEDLRRFERGEPISARRTGVVERSRKWVRRHPAAAMATLGLSLVAMLMVAGGGWYLSQRFATSKAVAALLREAAAFQQRSAWVDARAAIERAAAQLGGQGPEELRRSLWQIRRDSELAARLDVIRLEQAGSVGGVMNFEVISDQRFRDAFREWGVGDLAESAEEVAKRIERSNIKEALVAATYDWMRCSNPQTRKWLWKIAGLVDMDPTGWRDRIRKPGLWDNGKNLLAAVVEMDRETLALQPIPFLMTVSRQLASRGQEQVAFLKRVQDVYPQNFWVNLFLADAIRIKAATDRGAAMEAVQYYRAAISARPEAAIAFNNLGIVLGYAERHDDSILAFRHAIKLDSESTKYLFNLAFVLSKRGNLAESIPLWETCVKGSPKDVSIRNLLCQDYLKAGQVDEAEREARKIIGLKADYHPGQVSLRSALMAKGEDGAVLEAWKAYIEVDPSEHAAWDGYADFCLHLGRREAYSAACRELLVRFGDSSDASICERVGKTCLLTATTARQVREASVLIDRAISRQSTAPAWAVPYFQFARALAEYRGGRFESGAEIASTRAAGVMGPAPRLIASMCRWELGQRDEAQKLLALAVGSYDWTPTRGEVHERWMYDALREEAEEMMSPRGCTTRAAGHATHGGG